MQLDQRRLCSYLQATAEKARRDIVFDVLPAHDPLYGTVLANNSVQGDGDDEGGGARALLAHWEPQNDTGGRTETGPARCIRLAKREWVERVEGGVGCWTKEYLF